MPDKVRIPIFYQNLIKFVREHREPRVIEAYLEDLARSATLADLDYADPDVRTTGHRSYDALIEDIFTWVIRAISRESLLTQTIEALWSQKSSKATQCLFVLETIPGRTPEEKHDIKTATQKGLNEHLWLNFSEVIRTHLHDSMFLRDLLVKGGSVPLWLSTYIPNYTGEFDLLVRANQRHASQPKSYWISAIALKSGQVWRPNCVLIALYENRGDAIVPKLPSGANQEWRVLQFLGIAYQVLQHQLANVAEEVHGQRQRLLSILAPGILHHEMGIQIENIRGLLAVSNHIAQRLNDRYKEEDTERLQKNLDILTDAASRLYSIADAFNSMERRRPREIVSLEAILEEIRTLTGYPRRRDIIWHQPLSAMA